MSYSFLSDLATDKLHAIPNFCLLLTDRFCGTVRRLKTPMLTR